MRAAFKPFHLAQYVHGTRHVVRQSTRRSLSVTPQGPLKAGFDNGWFHEINEQWPGVACSLEVESMLFDEKSEYQHVQVFKSCTFGNVLLLDGVLQLTDRDEASYQEMIAHLPMFSHPNPKRVFIVGGGDGGVLREVVKHACVEEIVICEIDPMVISCGKKYFPTVASAWDDPRVTVVWQDANEYIKLPKNLGYFDVIIGDTSDPIGPAKALFEPPFYRSVHDALRPGGRVSMQAESMWLHTELIKSLISATSLIFPEVHYATVQIPTYPCGQIGLLQLQREGDATISTRSPVTPARTDDSVPLKYYSKHLHSAAFVQPKFLTDAIEAAKERTKKR